jgi:hypothetical protein
MTDEDSNQFVAAINIVMDFNRELIVKGHLFLLYFLASSLSSCLPIHFSFFTTGFFYGILPATYVTHCKNTILVSNLGQRDNIY